LLYLFDFEQGNKINDSLMKYGLN